MLKYANAKTRRKTKRKRKPRQGEEGTSARGSRGRVTRPGISPHTTRPLERKKRKRDTDTHEEDPARTLKEEGHKTQDVVCHTDETNFFFFYFFGAVLLMLEIALVTHGGAIKCSAREPVASAKWGYKSKV